MQGDDPNLKPIEIEQPSPWAVNTQPTRLVAPWVGDTPPTLVEVLAALGQRDDGDVEVVTELEPPESDIAWAAVVRLPDVSHEVIFWSEPARPIPDDMLPPAQRDAINASKWALGAETLLDRDEPLADYAAIVRAIASSWPEAPALFDLTSGVCHPRARLDEMFLDPDIDPPAEALWIMHGVHSGEPGDSSTTFWLHTHGLWRCGWAELEMLEVPAEYARSAAELLNTLADHVIESGVPAPGESWEIGPGLAVVAQPWQEVAPFVSGHASGGMSERGGDPESNPHTGVRAVICSPKKKGAFRKVWTWPQEVIGALDRDDATVWFTRRATEHREKLARKHFDEFATSFAAVSSMPLRDGHPPAVFVLKAGFAVDGDGNTDSDGGREHLWFELESVHREIIRGKLINDPIHVAMQRGEHYDIRRDQVSDWSMMSATGSIDPGRAAELWPSVERLRSGSQ